MRYAELKKQLIKESMIAAVALLLIGGITYYVMSMQEDYTARRNALQGEVSMVTNEATVLRNKYIHIQQNMDMYHLVTNLDDTDMLSNSAVVVDNRIREYERLYNLHKWTLDSGATNKSLTDPKYLRKNSHIVARDSTLTLEGVSDIDVYNPMQSIQKDFPGAVSFTGMRLARVSKLSDESLRSITGTGSFPLVTGELKFTWYGIESLDPEEAKKREASRIQKRGRRR